MVMEIEFANGAASATAGGSGSLETRPGILLVGSPNVGKRTLLSRTPPRLISSSSVYLC
jgi:hypothetical protein